MTLVENESLASYDAGAGLDLPEDLAYDAWEEMGPKFGKIAANALWWLGDWWRFGDRRYGEAAAQAVPDGYSLATLQQAARVAERFDSCRRLQNLTFSHHQEVAALEPAEADRLLSEAAAENMSQRELRDKVRELHPPKAHNANPEYLATFDAACVSLRRAVKAKRQSGLAEAVAKVQEALRAFPAPQDASGERQVTPIPKKGAKK